MTRLSSDVLEEQFGPTTLEVLEQGHKTRLICTKVVATGQILELSRVTFIQAGVDEFPDVHKVIVAGESMGKAFRAHNVEFTREVKSSQKRSMPSNFKYYFGSDEPVTVVHLTILVGPDKTLYAQIVETFSSAVDWPTNSA